MSNIITAGNATNNGTSISSDTSGVLELKTGSTPTTALTISTGQVVTVVNPIQGGTITSGTAVASTSGTSIDFTGIPSWVKRITVMFNNVSTNGVSNPMVQVGSGSIVTTGYSSSNALPNTGGTTGGNTNTTGWNVGFTNAANNYYGTYVITSFGSNIYIASFNLATTSTGAAAIGGGGIALSGALDRIRITTVNGTDTFDAGSINILYE